MRLLMRFEKGEDVKYISHLDMQRLFQRALRRAKLPCEYSKGFNPHLLISFACALPVGVCSTCEYVEVQLERFIHPLECKTRLNEVLPKGIKIVNAIEPKDDYPSVASVIALAEYTFIPEKKADYSQIISNLNNQDTILIEKKTKKGFKEVNVRPMIHRLKQVDDAIKATLSASNSENLRADKLREILENQGIKIKKTVRNSIFILNGNKIEEPIGEV